MASANTPHSAAPSTAPDTVVPKSYAKGIAMTPDPLAACAQLEHGGDRTCAWSVNQEVVHTPAPGRAKLEQRLLDTLAAPHCTAAGRAFFCQMLALIGSAKSVPALAAMLRHATTTEPARFALEAIPGPEAGAALRAALGAVSANAKAGLIGSIAARHDTAASAELTAIQSSRSESAAVREAASRALEQLASSSS
jgi:hypothetical protein